MTRTNRNKEVVLRPMVDQVGGHRVEEGKVGGLMEDRKRGRLYKPVNSAGGRAEREQAVYQALTDCKWIPRYYGVKQVDEKEYLVLEDLRVGMRSSSVLDVKMGTRTCRPDVSEEKLAASSAKNAVQLTIGYRICGLKRGDGLLLDRKFGRSLKSSEQFIDALVQLCKEEVEQLREERLADVGLIIEQLEQIQQWYTTQCQWSFYASSLLIVFDLYGCQPPKVRMIDFAHAVPIQHKDEDLSGYLLGIKTLISHFKAVLDII